TADASNERRAPGAEEAFAGDAGVAAAFRRLPHLCAGSLVDREEELSFARPAPLDAQSTAAIVTAQHSDKPSSTSPTVGDNEHEATCLRRTLCIGGCSHRRRPNQELAAVPRASGRWPGRRRHPSGIVEHD